MGSVVVVNCRGGAMAARSACQGSHGMVRSSLLTQPRLGRRLPTTHPNYARALGSAGCSSCSVASAISALRRSINTRTSSKSLGLHVHVTMIQHPRRLRCRERTGPSFATSAYRRGS